MVIEFLDNEMIGAVIWVGVAVGAFGLAFFWMVYLIKVTMNEEDVQDQIRRNKRIGEELLHAQESGNN